MIKWLASSRQRNSTQSDPTPLTNDPLAVITGADSSDGNGQIYSVTRVNPLFKEERSQDVRDDEPTLDENSDENVHQRLSPRKSISSGYESRCNSSSESSSCTECERKHAERKKSAGPGKREKRLTKQAKKRTADAESATEGSTSGSEPKGNSPGPAPAPRRRSKKYKAGTPPGSSNLSPIPEGKIDCSIPPPIWPRFGADGGSTSPDLQASGGMPFHDGTTNPLNFMYKYNEIYPKCCNGSSRSMWNYFDEKGQLSGAISVKTEYEHNWIECCRSQCTEGSSEKGGEGSANRRPPEGNAATEARETNRITRDVLRDLANLVSYAMKRRNMLSVEEILITLSESIQKSLDILSRQDGNRKVTVEADPYDGSAESKAEIYSSGSEGNNSSEDKDPVYAPVQVLNRDATYVTFPPPEAKDPRETAPEAKDNLRSGNSENFILHLRECSSSSTESGFEFSDSSPSPSSDSSSNERSGGVLNPVFLYDSVYGVPKSVQNAIMCESRNRTHDSLKETVTRNCGSSAFIKLINAKRKFSSGLDEIGPLTLHENGTTLSPSRTSKFDSNFTKKVEHPYYIAVGRPDFTLDLPQAEKLMKKLSSSKRRRCWCRLMTSLLGLVFFLFSVMMVSLIVTKGKRLFGAL